MCNEKMAQPCPSLDTPAYELSWDTVRSAIRRRKYLGDKTLEELSDHEYLQLREAIMSNLDHLIDDILEQIFEDYEAVNSTEEEIEVLWSQVSGEAKKRLSDALVYATKVEENARANAINLESILPEYNQRPELVVQQLYLDTLKEIMGNAQEKFLIQNSQDAAGAETRVMINRDKTIPRSTGSQETGTE